MITEPHSHFVVMWNYDGHHQFLGVYSSMEIVISNIKALPLHERASVMKNHRVYEYKGSEIVDEIDVCEVVYIEDDNEVYEYLKVNGGL